MQNDNRDEIVELRIPSQLRFFGLVDAVVQGFAADFGWDPDDLNNLSTAAIEAAANAIEHGNRYAADKQIRVRVDGDRACVCVEIEDEGGGFDPSPYEREMGPEDLLKLRGRGIFIMRSFMDQVSFGFDPRRGMRVRLCKRGRAAELAGGHGSTP